MFFQIQVNFLTIHWIIASFSWISIGWTKIYWKIPFALFKIPGEAPNNIFLSVSIHIKCTKYLKCHFLDFFLCEIFTNYWNIHQIHGYRFLGSFTVHTVFDLHIRSSIIEEIIYPTMLELIVMINPDEVTL